MSHPLPPALHRRNLLLGALAFGNVHATSRLVNSVDSPYVVVVGAGMAGLSAAWELEQSGFNVTVLEVNDRVGGRNWTVRPGDTVPDTSSPAQLCDFSPGQYLNAGAWRILPWHHRMLRCAQRHGIALEALPSQVADDAPVQLQPVGGMDAIPRAIAQALRSPVRTNTQVLSVKHTSIAHRSGIAVLTRCNGLTRWLEADYAVIAVPLGQLDALDLDLPARVRQGLRSAQSADAIKIAFETGQLASLERRIAMQGRHILWPSGSLPVAQQIACVYGNAQLLAGEFGVPRHEQIEHAQSLLRAAAEQPTLELNNPLVVHWSRIPFANGAAMRFRKRDFNALRQLRSGVPPIFFAGDALSSLNGWQEGALDSAQHAVQLVLQHQGVPFSPTVRVAGADHRA